MLIARAGTTDDECESHKLDRENEGKKLVREFFII
jgi:hypothetical protein